MLQDTDAPLIFVMNDELELFERGTLFVDVSCDEGMGFEWARPTSFAEPMFDGRQRGIHYYAVDHSPSLSGTRRPGRSARRCSRTCRSVMDGPGAWDADETIARAIEIRDGVIENPKILSFQERAPRTTRTRGG